MAEERAQFESPQHVDADELGDALRNFYEDWPLYSRLTIHLEEPQLFRTVLPGKVCPPSLSMACTKCVDQPVTTWTVDQATTDPRGRIFVLYECSHCQEKITSYWVRLLLRNAEHVVQGVRGGHSTHHGTLCLTKVGQDPEQAVTPPADVNKYLNEDSRSFYIRSETSLAHGYGLGALAYSRRIIENTVDEILELLLQDARERQANEAATKLEEAQESKRAEDKLRLAAEALPSHLRPGDSNPLRELYDIYSEGIHNLTEQECRERALRSREAFNYVFVELRSHLDRAAQFRSYMENGD